MSVVDLMRAAEDVFVECGGHHGAGGFTVIEDKVHTLQDALLLAHGTLAASVADLAHEVFFDTDLSIEEVNESLLKTLRMLAPYGEGNAKPLFRFNAVTPSRVEAFGKAKEHTKLLFDREHGVLEAIYFFKKPEEFHAAPEAGKELTLIAHVEESFFMGRKQTRLRIVDIL